jgi:hypothetical protein
MTYQDALDRVRSLHPSMTLARSYGNEYRVNFYGGEEETAYYTTDLADAVATAEAMANALLCGCTHPPRPRQRKESRS